MNTCTELEYKVRLLVVARVKIEIDGQDLDRHDTFDLIYVYLIDCAIKQIENSSR